MSWIKTHIHAQNEKNFPQPLFPIHDLAELSQNDWNDLLSSDLQAKNKELFIRLLHTRNLISAHKRDLTRNYERELGLNP